MSSSTPSPNDSLKGYVEYLDKEMTIMGILSTFCIVSLGFVAEKLLFPGKDSTHEFWDEVTILAFLGLTGFLLAALCFYRQRSLLAWYFGQISLYKAREDDAEVKTLLTKSDAWFNWTWYQAGFGCLSLAFLSFGAVCLSSECIFIVRWQVLIGCSILFLCGVCTAFTIVSYLKYPYEDNPGVELRKSIFCQS